MGLCGAARIVNGVTAPPARLSPKLKPPGAGDDETKRNETDAYAAIYVNLLTTGRTSPPPAVAEGRRESVLTDSKWGFSPVQNGRPCTGRGAAGGRGQSREQSLNFGPCCCRQPPPLFTINEFQNRRLPPSDQLVSRRLFVQHKLLHTPF